jgi:hypothetical protein
VPINFEEDGDTLFSPRQVLKEGVAHCFEGALFAAAVLMYHGGKPILLDLKTVGSDDGHVVALFRARGLWGAISKTNHAVLRFRDPVYKSPRELAMSYFHEYFLNNGKKTLRSYATLNLQKVKRNWVTDEEDVWYVDRALDRARHEVIVRDKDAKRLRSADKIERDVGKFVVWRRKGRARK